MQSHLIARKICVFLILLSSTISYAQYKYTVKGALYGGWIIPHSKNLHSIAKGVVLGGEVAFELPAESAVSHWQQFWRFPNLGVGLGFINLGNNQLLGNAIYAYPYISIPMLESEYWGINLKMGAGLSFVTKTWYNADTLSGVDARTANSAFSFPINCYLTASANFTYRINARLSLAGDVGYSHMSNGSFRNPNFGVNIIYAQLGARYNLVPYNRNMTYNPAYGLPFDFEAKVVASGFSRQINYRDHKSFFVGSLHAGITAPITDWYALGGGADLFYDGAFIKRPSDDNPLFARYKIDEDKFANKLRFGIAVNNEFIMGRFSGIVDVGVYLYDPIKNSYPHVSGSRGIFYGYDIKKEDGWSYIRLAMRYRVYDNFVIQTGIKLHSNVAEMLEVGVGYLLPFTHSKHTSVDRRHKTYRLYRYDYREPVPYPTPWVD